jgi:hypothetical protein
MAMKKKLALVAVISGAILGTGGTALAQAFYFGFDPGYQQYYGPPPYYGGPQYYYDVPRYRHYPRRGRYRGYGDVCGPGWSLQDGFCKPYRGF